MNVNGLSPEGDLPANHPLVLEALRGIISGPISELRTEVDNLIVTSSNSLNKGLIDYNNILPNINVNGAPRISDTTTQITNNILNDIAPVQYLGNPPPQNPVQSYIATSNNKEFTSATNNDNSNQMELPLFKQSEVNDIHKKLFDLERKLDIIIKYVKNIKN